jgi:euchromatic histone-lysine N-methyltransferase
VVRSGVLSKERAEDMRQMSGLSDEELAMKRRFTLDARQCGNVGRFVNHDRDPNLFMQPVCVDHRDPRQPRLCLFAMRPIPAFQELTYDYGEGYDKKWLTGGSSL